MNPISFLTQMLRISVPYLFAASGGVIAERAGIISLALEGFMLTGAFSATLGAYYSGSPWIGVLCGILGGLVFGMIHAVATIRYRA
jgi:simple sugar transport system permease protein